MKLEYLADASTPLIRLYEFNQAEVQQLRERVSSLVAGTRQSVPLHKEAWTNQLTGAASICVWATKTAVFVQCRS
jgi:hypothetical protein